jgi:DNA-binding CsgD family transcriptional regulator
MLETEPKKGAPLTKREQEIYNHLLQGKTPKEIAYKLEIEYITAMFHIRNMLAKLGASSVNELLAQRIGQPSDVKSADIKPADAKPEAPGNNTRPGAALETTFKEILRRAMAFSPITPAGGQTALADKTAPDIGVFEYGISLIAGGADHRNIDTLLSDIIAQEPDSTRKTLAAVAKAAVLGIQQGLLSVIADTIGNNSDNIAEATIEELTAMLEMSEEEARKYTQLGQTLEAQGHYRNALKWYTKAAEKGNAAAMVNLGHLYQAGRGVPQDDAAPPTGGAVNPFLSANDRRAYEAMADYWFKRAAKLDTGKERINEQ